jgi:hypothetical protein
MRIGIVISFVYLFCMVHLCSATDNVRKAWMIRNGDCKDCIQMPSHDDIEISIYDFAVYDDKLFLSDYRTDTIKIFDKNNRNIKTIKLSAMPRTVTIHDGKLYILLHNNSIGIYNIDRDHLTEKIIEDKFTPIEYGRAFFYDNMLVLLDMWGVYKSDAKVYDINNPNISNTIFNFIDISDFPVSGSFMHRTPRLIDIRGGNNTYLILNRFESNKTAESSGYMIYNRKNKSLNLLTEYLDEYGIIIANNEFKGMKIHDGRIYFISEIIGEGENAVIIGSFPLPKEDE